MTSRYNTRLIKSRKSYSIKEMESLLGVDRKTCSRWITDDGLKVMQQNVKPILVMGSDLKIFLEDRRIKKKVPLADDQFYCLKCHKAVVAKLGSEKVVKTGKKIGKNLEDQFKKIGLCDFCDTRLNRLLGLCQKD